MKLYVEKIKNYLVVMRRNKVTLTLNKAAHVGMWILDLRKTLMYEFYYDHIKNKYGNKLILSFSDTDSMMYEIKTEDVYEDFGKDKEMFVFRSYSTESKYYNDSNKLVVSKRRYQTGGDAIKEFVGLKPKMYSLLGDDSSGYKEGKEVNYNVAETVIHDEYKDVWLNNYVWDIQWIVFKVKIG